MVNHLLEGVPFAATKAILDAADDVGDVEAGVSRYRADPEAFEASLDSAPAEVGQSSPPGSSAPGVACKPVLAGAREVGRHPAVVAARRGTPRR